MTTARKLIRLRRACGVPDEVYERACSSGRSHRRSHMTHSDDRWKFTGATRLKEHAVTFARKSCTRVSANVRVPEIS